jgi:hypothetical protein
MVDIHSPKRRPHNAITDSIAGSPLSDPGVLMSASPQSLFLERTQSLDAPYLEDIFDLSKASPSARSEIEVILDDGTTQKRTVSLSTLPDVSPENEEPR